MIMKKYKNAKWFIMLAISVTLVIVMYKTYNDSEIMPPNVSGIVDLRERVDLKNLTFIKTIKMKETNQPIGDIYVKFHNKDKGSWDELYVISKDQTLFKVDRNGIYNSNKVLYKQEMPANTYNKVNSSYDDHFIISMVSAEGKNMSDDLTIVWDKKNKEFNVLNWNIFDN